MKKKRSIVFYPTLLEGIVPETKLYGYYQSDTDIFNIVSCDAVDERTLKFLGFINPNTPNTNILTGTISPDGAHFSYQNNTYRGIPYSLERKLFSRISSLLDTDKLSQQAVIIVGCGSVGSFVALELARSGVGNFLLIDNDIIEYHNICRHQCGISDIGKLKTDALKERIHDINPFANVSTFFGIIEDAPEIAFVDAIKDQAIFVGCADNRGGDIYTNKIARHFNSPFVSIGLWERAFAGEIFYAMPHEGPCYGCLVHGMSLDGISGRKSVSRRLYITDENMGAEEFEPGISADISFVSNIGVKIIIDLLLCQDSQYTPRIIDSMKNYTFICNTNKSRFGGDLAEIFSYPLQVTRSLNVKKLDNCLVCGGR